MPEPDNHGRLIAAERNALAAIDLAKNAMSKLGEVEAELVKAHQIIHQQQNRLDAFENRAALLQGTVMALEQQVAFLRDG